MKILIKNIKQLIQTEDEARINIAGKSMSKINSIKDAFLFIKDGKIFDFGEMKTFRTNENFAEMSALKVHEIDAVGKMVFPSFCDSHTHLVYAGSREIEYTDKIKGLSYEEIAKRGGGILNSAKLLHDTSEEDLYLQSLRRINEIIALGTGAVEIKSGYGLSVEDELKMLRVIKRLKKSVPLTIKSTFLGAHAVPMKYKNNQSAYVDLIINEMLPKIAEENLADYIDVFCERGFLQKKKQKEF